MNIDTMRRVDFWIGIPICFLLDIVYFMTIPFRSGNVRHVKSVLFLELSEMGSAIISAPAMKEVKKVYPSAEMFFLIFEKNRPSVDMLELLPRQNVLTIRGNNLFHLAIDSLKVVFKLRRMKLDVLLDLELFSRFTAILSFLIGARKRAGFYKFHNEGLYRGRMQTHKVWYNPHRHMAVNFMSLLYATTSNDWPHTKKRILLSDIVPHKVAPDKEAIDRLRTRLEKMNPSIKKAKKIIIINPNASKLLPIRTWPRENYVTLVQSLAKEKDLFFIFTGVKDDIPDGEALSAVLSKDLYINLVDKTSFDELLPLYHMCDMLVSNDSGPPHFASLTNIMILVFFGPETPELYGPLTKNKQILYSDFACSPCVSAANHRKTSCTNNKCLKAIPSEYVKSIVLHHLRKKMGSLPLLP